MWKEMCAGGYLQVNEIPVKVLDPEVKGKAACGYLRFYAVPGGDVILEFDPGRGITSRNRTNGRTSYRAFLEGIDPAYQAAVA
jgi:hypothetical protein